MLKNGSGYIKSSRPQHGQIGSLQEGVVTGVSSISKVRVPGCGNVYVRVGLALVFVFVGWALFVTKRGSSDPLLSSSLVNVASHEAAFVSCETTKGKFRIKLSPLLAPNGTAFFRGIVKAGYWGQHIPFFRVNKHMTQFGITKRAPRESDPFIEFRKGADRDENPYGGVGKDAKSTALRKAHPWPRGTIASIGGFQFVVVIKANSQMGTSRHDAPLGKIPEEDMKNVFDNLYKYNDIINNRHGGPGVDQSKLQQLGLPYIKKQFPKTDMILSCKEEVEVI
mmetsp:Transcript_10213/g.16694  ORF Transcript_10213/g.16694 Transcript_10213/m.16694 type:complete len:280 (-) Transcript_10213:69-908(-)